jgi:hypothetical protein
MLFSIQFDKNYIPCNFFTTLVVGLTGFVLVTFGRIVPDGYVFSFFSIALIMIGWVCYIVALVGISAVIIRFVLKRPCNPIQ